MTAPVRDEFLPFNPPQIGEDERRAVADVLMSEWITTGPATRQFEAEFAATVSAERAVALNSCTAGLHVALLALGVGEGDEVITTPTTFCATANVIEHVGAKPVLADIDPGTMQMDPEAVRAAVTPRTRAMIPVHFTGHPCDMDALGEIAREHGLRVVEDAAHAYPASFRARPIGSISDATAFSFYATKNLTTAEGGMLTMASEELEARVRTLALHGMSRDAWKRYNRGGAWFYEVLTPGFKYNMTDIQAAMGLAQLRRIGEMSARRQRIAERYLAAFSEIPSLELPVVAPDVEHAWHLFVLRLRPEMLCIDRDAFIEEMTRRNIGTSVHFIPIHLHPYYRDRYGYRAEQFPSALDSYNRCVSLPLYPSLSDADVDYVIDSVRAIVAESAR